MKRFFLANCLLILSCIAAAQDFHLSQYDANPLYLNPALTGLRMNEDWICRANINVREQWDKFLSKSFMTTAAGFEIPLSERFSMGQSLYNNAGAGGQFNTFSLMMSGSYNITHKSVDDPHTLSVGLQLGLLQKSINPGNLVYDSQYSSSDPDVFDTHLPSGETYKEASMFRLDANIGIYYRFIKKENRYSPFAGFSVYHFNRPDESFTGLTSKIPMRFAFHAGEYYKLNESFNILGKFLYMNQANVNEFGVEADVFYKIQGTECEPMLGAAWRNQDAVVIHVGLKQKMGILRISYDITTSYLKQYTNGGRGGLEVSFVYTGQRKKKDITSAPKIIPAEEKTE